MQAGVVIEYPKDNNIVIIRILENTYKVIAMTFFKDATSWTLISNSDKRKSVSFGLRVQNYVR